MKVKKIDPKGRQVIKMKTTQGESKAVMAKWWLSKNEKQRVQELLSTTAYLKESQAWRQRAVATYARLYGNQSLYSSIGQDMSKIGEARGLHTDRPTFNLISAVTDTLLSKLTQNRPAPIFLTDNSDYKERRLAKQLNNFILGEFYQTKAYEKAEYILRDALVTGTGVLKVFETEDCKVGIERVLQTELFTDLSESMYDNPRQIYQIKLVDREVLAATFPEMEKDIMAAAGATPDSSPNANQSVADLLMVVEGWRLPSFKAANDGAHTIAIAGCDKPLVNEPYIKDCFPFVFLHHTKRLAGFWAQGIAESSMGTQLELNSILWTISRALKLGGVPRFFVEKGSKVVKAHLNNEVGGIVEYAGKMPEMIVTNSNAADLYAERDRLIQYGFRQEGLSEMAATSQKPAGLDSGEAIRTYDNINTDRFAALSKRYDNFFIELAYLIMDLAREIAIRDGKYQTVFPDKNGTKEVDLPKSAMLDDPFVIQCFNMSSLPKDPAGRQQKVTEMIQSGMLTIKEGRRLLDYPDLSQIETLDNASEERIFKYLDQIVEDGKYEGPDPFMDLALAQELCVKYYNLYVAANLEESKAEMLRVFFSQVQSLMQAAQPPMPPPGMPPAAPQANPEPAPTSPLVPNSPNPQMPS
jgi:hypothetical protein